MTRRQGTPVELADVLRQHLANFQEENPALSPEQYKAVHAIQNCRTAVLGGHVDKCDSCGFEKHSYNSCRNRHCPKCGALNTARWLAKRQAELLPVRYFHVVFTLPHALNNWVRYNQRALYNQLFRSAWHALNTLGQDTKRLGGQMGMLSVLHTWGQNLTTHNHVHCIVPGGALTKAGRWQGSTKYLFPVTVISKLFRGHFVSNLRQLYDSEELKAPSDEAYHQFSAMLKGFMKIDWVVYAKPPFDSPENVLQYLGRYTHKAAITNNRIIRSTKDAVTFMWRDYRDDNQQKIMQLKPNVFIRRVIDHVLPSGFNRIRSFGFLANAAKKKRLTQIKKFLGKPITQEEIPLLTAKDFIKQTTRVDISRCPKCKKGNWIRVTTLLPKFGRTLWDTS